MQEGYSTATDQIREMGFGAGMGLHNIKSCADTLDISSEVNKGTHLSIVINRRGSGNAMNLAFLTKELDLKVASCEDHLAREVKGGYVGESFERCDCPQHTG